MNCAENWDLVGFDIETDVVKAKDENVMIWDIQCRE